VTQKSGDILNQLRTDWDRRITHDYRYWMSDGVQSDAAMWEAGERDLQIILKGLPDSELSAMVALEIGCGVGRLVRAAARRFGKVIGLDISPKAVDQGRELLKDLKNVELVCGNGADLSVIPNNSVDCVFSFAALCSMPVEIIASYICETARVLRPRGIVRFQIYTGHEQQTCVEDTLAIRSFDAGRVTRGFEAAGFRVESIEELILPFEISDKEGGQVAQIVALKKISDCNINAQQLKEILLSAPEQVAGQNWAGSKTEYYMALARARQLMEAGKAKDAVEALRFAVDNYAEPESEVLQMLRDLENSIQGSAQSATRSVTAVSNSFAPAWISDSNFKSEIYENNLRVINERFPGLLAVLQGETNSSDISIKLGDSGEPIVCYKGLPLSQVNKPVRAAEVWAERTLNTSRVKSAESLMVVGIGSGHHVVELKKTTGKKLFIFEPNVAVLKTVLGMIDLRLVLESCGGLSCSMNELLEELKSSDALAKSEIVIYPQTQALCGEAVDQIRKAFVSKRGLKTLRPSIAVVGPIYGGSLPIAAYAELALKDLKQRVHGYDLSCFHDAYRNLGAFVRKESRVNAIQSHYVDMLSQLVLESLSERPVDILICLAQAPLNPKVLTELRNKGTITVMWFVEDCRRFHTWKEISRYFDYMFIIQKGEFLQLVEQAGAGRAIYLPVGCHPLVHRPMELTAEEKQHWGSPLSFVGAGYNNRQKTFTRLAQRDFKIWGTEWPNCAPFDRLVQEQGRRLTPAEYVKIFNASTVNLNLHSSMERDGVEPFGDFVNPRTFELASAGAFQLTDNRALLPEMFEVGKEVITFDDAREMEEKIDYYLAHDDERQQVVQAGRARALKDHTYERRLEEMLSYIYADRFEELQNKVKQGPWEKTLDAATPYPELRGRLETAFERGDEPNLESIVADIQTGKGTLTETEQRLLFLHHIKTQIRYINELRDGKSQ